MSGTAHTPTPPSPNEYPRAQTVRGPADVSPPYAATRYVQGALFDAEVEAAAIRAEAERRRAEVEAIRADAERAGWAAGRSAIEAMVIECRATHERCLARYEEDVLLTASAIVSALLNVDEHFYDEAIASLAGAALASVRRERSITIHAAPKAAAWLAAMREDLARHLLEAHDVQVVTDDALDPASIRVTTEHGERTYSFRSRLRRLRRASRTTHYGMQGLPPSPDPRATLQNTPTETTFS